MDNGETKRIYDKLDTIQHATIRIEGKQEQHSKDIKRCEEERGQLFKSYWQLGTDITIIKEHKNTTRMAWGDIAKIVGAVGILFGILFGILRYANL